MNLRQIVVFVDRYLCDIETAWKYSDLREDGYTHEKALQYCGLVEPLEAKDA